MAAKNGNILKFFFGLISGLVAGTVIGLLFAPKRGDQIIDDITSKAKDIKGKAKTKLDDIQQLSKDGLDRIKTTLQEKASEISHKLDELAKRGSEVLIQDEIQ